MTGSNINLWTSNLVYSMTSFSQGSYVSMAARRIFTGFFSNSNIPVLS